MTMEFVVGDRVKVICAHASHGWGQVSRGDVGTVAEVYVGREKLIVVNFRKQKDWHGPPSEFELVKPAENGPNRELKKPEREW